MTSLEQHLEAHTQSTRCVDGWTLCACKCGAWIADIGDRRPTKAHRAHVADTWREARTVRTVEELDALPTGAIIREGGDALHVDHGPRGEWTGTATVLHILHGRLTIGDIDGDWNPFPALILWTPEDGAL